MVVMHTATFLATLIGNKGLSYLCTTNNVSWLKKNERTCVRTKASNQPEELYHVCSVMSCLSNESRASFWDFTATN